MAAALTGIEELRAEKSKLLEKISLLESQLVASQQVQMQQKVKIGDQDEYIG